MSSLPEELKYVASHQWVRDEGDGTVTVGITDFAQDQLGDVVYVELPEVGSNVTAEQDIAVVESVKSASDIPAPVSGQITETNTELEDNPEAINEDPYGEAWLFKIELSSASELESLLSEEQYTELLD